VLGANLVSWSVDDSDVTTRRVLSFDLSELKTGGWTSDVDRYLALLDDSSLSLQLGNSSHISELDNCRFSSRSANCHSSTFSTSSVNCHLIAGFILQLHTVTQSRVSVQ